MVKLVNRAKMSTATTGTGTITLGSAATGYQSFAPAGVADGDVVRYVIEDGDNWEIGSGTYTATGTTLTRTVSESSNAGAAITLTGSAVVFVSAVANDFGDSLGTVTSDNLDLSTGNFFEVTTADQTLTFSNAPAAHEFTVKVTGGGTSGFSLPDKSFDSITLDVSAQEVVPQSLFFKEDGTKLYMAGRGVSNSIHQYNLSTAFDLSTASLSATFNSSAQETSPNGLAFNAQGTKMYMLGFNSDRVHQYSLATAFDISTASYDTIFFSLTTQTGVASSLTFSNDGTKMHVGGGGIVYQYTLTTAFDVSTVVYDSVSYNFSAQETAFEEHKFNPTGTRMYVVGRSSDKVHQYSLATAFDISTASYDNISVIANGGLSDCRALTFSTDGAKMYLAGNTTAGGGLILQYSAAGVGNSTITYPASVKFPAATPPAIPAIGEVDTLVFYTVDGGTTFYGYQLGDNHG